MVPAVSDVPLLRYLSFKTPSDWTPLPNSCVRLLLLKMDAVIDEQFQKVETALNLLIDPSPSTTRQQRQLQISSLLMKSSPKVSSGVRNPATCIVVNERL